jgi:site-specific DNA recombinase
MARLDELATEKERRQNRDREIKVFIEAMKKQPLVLEKWDERLWVALIDRATVHRDGGIVFRFKSGKEIEV